MLVPVPGNVLNVLLVLTLILNPPPLALLVKLVQLRLKPVNPAVISAPLASIWMQKVQKSVSLVLPAATPTQKTQPSVNVVALVTTALQVLHSKRSALPVTTQLLVNPLAWPAKPARTLKALALRIAYFVLLVRTLMP